MYGFHHERGLILFLKLGISALGPQIPRLVTYSLYGHPLIYFIMNYIDRKGYQMAILLYSMCSNSVESTF